MLPSKFAKNDSPSKETSLFVVKCSFPRGRIIFLKLAREHIAARFRSKCRTQGENSISKMGFMLKELKNHSKSMKRFRLKSEGSWCLKNEHFFVLFFALRLRVARARHGQDTGRTRAGHGQDTGKTRARHGQDTGKTQARHRQDKGKKH